MPTALSETSEMHTTKLQATEQKATEQEATEPKSFADMSGPERWQHATPISEALEDAPSQKHFSSYIYYRNITKRIWTVMQEGMRRGFQFKVLGDVTDRTFVASRDGKGFTYRIYPGHVSFWCQYDDYDAEQAKAHKLALMKADGLSVPVAYGLFNTFEEIPLSKCCFPLVAKPNTGSLSENVFPHLQNAAQLKQAADTIAASGKKIQVESHIYGKDYRVLILDHQYAGCVERRPANVVGDGQRTIAQLFQARNAEPGRAARDEAHTTIHYLVFDDTTHHLLENAGYTSETILPAGETFHLQTKITASTGSDYIDCTEHIHPSIIESCVAFSYRFTTLTLGFDVITTDISRPLTETHGAFNEYNFLPYVDLHENCNIGTKRPVCELIWDHIEARSSQIVTPDFEWF
ncbi:MAG: hypothetical protein AB8B99_15960 [Phormidesmis sp.]